MLNRGEIEDSAFVRALEKAAELVKLEEMGGDYFYVDVPKRKSDLQTGKVFLKAKPRAHGMGETPTTFRDIMAGERFYRQGGEVPLVNAPAHDLAGMTAYLEQHVMPSSITKIGSLGSREQPTDAEALGRTAALLSDTYNGYSSVTGIPYNGVALDAGHRLGHASHPELSNAPSNITMENQYMNKGKSTAEKIAFQQGRAATNEELADSLFRSFINKITSEVTLPNRNTTAGKAEYAALMDRINSQI